jgi:hypothetical protein
MSVRFRGTSYELDAVPTRLVIGVEAQRLSLVWHGAWPTPEELPDRFPEEGDDETMELEGVDAFIDGALVPKGREP